MHLFMFGGDEEEDGEETRALAMLIHKVIHGYLQIDTANIYTI